MPKDATSETGSLTVRGYCSCGASCKVSSNPPRAARSIYASFREMHDELGHRGVTAAEAARVRRRQRAEMESA